MSRISRNAPCPCGSGRKYKGCCGKAGATPKFSLESNSSPASMSSLIDEVDALDALSNSVLALVKKGRLDEAEAACKRLLADYPDQPDGLERSAIVYEAKGEYGKAADYLDQAADFMQSSEGFSPELITDLRSDAKRLRYKT